MSASEPCRKVYDGACQGCHEAGGRPLASTRPLAGASLKHGNAYGEMFQNIRAGIRDKTIPSVAQLSTEQIWEVVSYLRSLTGPSPLVDTVAGDIEAGHTLFEAKAKCLGCHQLNGRGTPVGSDMSAKGRLPAEQPQEKILEEALPPPR